MDHCKSCEADVVFVPSAKSGKPMILDAKPRKGIVLVDRRSVMPVLMPEPGEPVAHVVDVYTDHHATCPDVRRYR